MKWKGCSILSDLCCIKLKNDESDFTVVLEEQRISVNV